MSSSSTETLIDVTMPQMGVSVAEGTIVAWRVDVGERSAVLDGEPLALTRKEFDLLAYLAARPGRVVSRRELLEEVWRQPSVGEENRKRLEAVVDSLEAIWMVFKELLQQGRQLPLVLDKQQIHLRMPKCYSTRVLKTD